MSFVSPLWLLTLLVVPAAIGAYVVVRRRRLRYALAFTNLDVLATVVPRRSWRRAVPAALFLLAVAALCVGLARPRVRTWVPQDHATVILVLDASRSMQSNDVRPTRLRAAEEAVHAFVDRAPKRLQLALIVFAGDVQVASPPTYDHALVLRSLRLAENYPGYSGTAIGDALQAAVQLGKEAEGRAATPTIALHTSPPAPTRAADGSPLVSILFLSDGRQTTGVLAPMAGADLARAAGFPVYTVALGTNQGSLPGFNGSPPTYGPFGGGGSYAGGFTLAPDRPTLRAIAVRTGGEYFPARTAQAAHDAYARLGSRLGRRRSRAEITFLFLAIAAGLLAAAGITSAVWAPRLP